ncbi:MAG: hypothetical protein HUU46_18275 [Candidatus Hydrogenedentes bacterium]|nr:hypothetical protein [Candidatus Hydrogenedentota bacterium]
MKPAAQQWEYEVQSWWNNLAVDPPPLRITHAAMRGLFSVSPFSGVTVSTDQAEGISLFAGISPVKFLCVCAALGLTQWRALDLNAMLVAEDLAHVEPGECLFAPRSHRSDYALAFEDPFLCAGCFDFYHCLGADREIVAAAELLRSLRKPTLGNPIPAPVRH